MVKQVLIYFLFIILLASCTALKPVNTAGKDHAQPATPKTKEKKELTFLNINTGTEQGTLKYETPPVIGDVSTKKVKTVNPESSTDENVENASSLQLKYSILMNTEVENIRDQKMFEFIDDWYGTRYRLGGTTKKGIDCSAFTQLFFLSLYGIDLPRTVREQKKFSSQVSRTDLREGDLVFFNTGRGYSHVGVYLQNNKFVHASSSNGVTISDLFDPYWLRRFIGVGRVDSAMTNR